MFKVFTTNNLYLNGPYYIFEAFMLPEKSFNKKIFNIPSLLN